MTQLFAKNSGYGIDNSPAMGADQFLIIPNSDSPDGTNASTRNNFEVAFDGTGSSTEGKGWYAGNGFNTPSTGQVSTINYDFDYGNTQDVSLSQFSSNPTLLFMQDSVTWDFFMNTLFGGADKMFGSAHNDKLVGYNGDDIIFGGYGDKPNSGTFAAGSTTTFDGSTYPGFGYASDGKDELYGGMGEDTLDGGTDADKLFGGSENDTLFGGGGVWGDLLNGGAGADSMTGGMGDDTYVVDNAGDTVTELSNEGTDTVKSSVSYVLGDHVEHLTLIKKAAINGTGNALSNTLTGNKNGNTLKGEAGDDHVHGGGGNDKLYGGTGKDHFMGGKGNDTFFVDRSDEIIVELAKNKGGIDKVVSTVDYTLGANLENLTLAQNKQDLSGTGNGLRNVIKGNANDNVLSGKAGNDVLAGKSGADWMSGGTGRDIMWAGKDTFKDVFDFDTAQDSGKGKKRDAIKQFDRGEDKIDLAGIDAKMGGSDQAFKFSSGPAANSVWITGKGKLAIVNADVTGDKVADFQISVAGVGTLDASDFVL